MLIKMLIMMIMVLKNTQSVQGRNYTLLGNKQNNWLLQKAEIAKWLKVLVTFTFAAERAGWGAEIMDICKKVSQLLSTSNWIILATRILLPLAKIIMIIWMKMMIVMMTMLNKVTKGLNRRQLDWEGSLLQRDVLSVPRDFDTRQDTSRGQHGALRL